MKYDGSGQDAILSYTAQALFVSYTGQEPILSYNHGGYPESRTSGFQFTHHCLQFSEIPQPQGRPPILTIKAPECHGVDGIVTA
jgi:hypothetical protein